MPPSPLSPPSFVACLTKISPQLPDQVLLFRSSQVNLMVIQHEEEEVLQGEKEEEEKDFLIEILEE